MPWKSPGTRPPPAMIADHPELAGIPLLQGGDVHFLDDFLGVNLFRLAAPTLQEIRLALADSQGAAAGSIYMLLTIYSKMYDI